MLFSLRLQRDRARRRTTPTILAGLTATLSLFACSPLDPTRASQAYTDAAIVYVIGRGWHTDIGLPIEEISGPLAVLEQTFPGVRFLTFGFGERQFLVTRQNSLIAMLAALLPSRSALLVTALSASPDTAFGREHVVALRVSQAGLEMIEARIWQEFEQFATGDPMILADGPYPGSVFYAARDTYSGLNTCNTWTAQVLRSGALPMVNSGILFAGQVMGMARWIGAQQALPGRS